MADKYIDTSLTTGLNDGTSAANAWRSAKEVFTNTQASGSVTAGDTIHVRTHDGTSNCFEPIIANLTFAMPTSVSSPTKVVFDDGTVWADGGRFRIDMGASFFTVTLQDYIHIMAHGVDYRLEVYSSNSANLNQTFVEFVDCVTDGIHLNLPSQNGYNLCDLGDGLIQNFKITLMFSRASQSVFSRSIEAKTIMINPVIELTGTPTDNFYIFDDGTDGSGLEVIGGKIVVTDIIAIESYCYLIATAAVDNSFNKFIDFQTGAIAGIYGVTGTAKQRSGSVTTLLGNGGVFNYHEESIGRIEFEEGKFYPYLSSTLPNVDSDGWSYKLSPGEADKGMPQELPTTMKIFNQPASIKTLTMEFLIGTAFTSVDKSVLWATFHYIDDSTGEMKTISTYSPTGVVSSSTATWTNTSYGEKAYNKYKISVTTQTSIRQGTKIIAKAYSGIKEVTLGDFLFFEPDIILS